MLSPADQFLHAKKLKVALNSYLGHKITHMKKMFFLFGTVALLIACSEKTSPTAVTETTPEIDRAEMTTEAASGKQIFETSCQRCHGLKTIDKYSEEQWSTILPRMSGKAKLDAEQTALVDAYIQWELAN
ncbi:MAG: hypothetical protein A3D92_18560 [Bacteroidetes bacterium RIFCSPHIGHO2_02_FULL_44_7]|nr:MAG: hypothetical protein A3D92_18560 [Bacteroidetes bacterium RIFCSPHIGHO2_02_FULL_44_7]